MGGAKKVIGIDLQEKVIPLTNNKAKERGLSDKVEFIHVQSLRWPFPDNTFDVVFSKDALLHTPDKETLYAEIKRVLKPGGVVRYADWFTTDLPPTPEMEKWLDENKLTMVLKSLGSTADIFVRLGFADIELEDLAEHFGTIFHEDMAKLDTQVGESMQQDFGKDTFESLRRCGLRHAPSLPDKVSYELAIFMQPSHILKGTLRNKTVSKENPRQKRRRKRTLRDKSDDERELSSQQEEF